VGESGCGKTMTALSIMGLLPQDMSLAGGAIAFEGRRIDRLLDKEMAAIRGKDMAMIFQEPMTSLDPLKRIGEQVAEPLLLHGEKNKEKARTLALESMRKAGLPDVDRLSRLYPHELSGGMRQRAMIASATVCKPALLIADEPTTALDVSIQAKILALLSDINRQAGTAVLFVSHNLRLVARLCSRVVVMYAGRVVEEGPAVGLFNKPLHPYTRGLVASIPGKASRGKPLRGIGGRVPSIDDETPPCPFAPRCDKAGSECFKSFPKETCIEGDRHVWCHSI
jgi:oligopeptide/dipeptide ABC transporter ATP-binding protein